MCSCSRCDLSTTCFLNVCGFGLKARLMSPMFNFSVSETSARREFHASVRLACYCFLLCRHMPGDRRANESAAWEELLLHMLKPSGFLNNRTSPDVSCHRDVCARGQLCPFLPSLGFSPDVPLSSAPLGLFSVTVSCANNTLTRSSVTSQASGAVCRPNVKSPRTRTQTNNSVSFTNAVAEMLLENT